ncbi:MAG: PD40 domain-containing protein [Bacteroidia bacterium]|nr:PD40 domain-containing protein [Bacteroidia bacterium]
MRSIYFLSAFLVFFSGRIFSQQNDSVKIEITNLGAIVNSTFADYAPVISADGHMIVFTSRRPSTEKEIKKNKEGMETVWVSYFDDKTQKWSAPVKLDENINMANRHNSNISLSADGQQMWLYHDDASGNGDIYSSVLKGNLWTATEKLPEPVNSKDHETSASFSADGNTVYFVSNRSGGIGDKDIYMAKLGKDGKWGKAMNLGKTINTSSDEEGVYIHPDGTTLFFSSKGHNSIGGYDIYKTEWLKDHWSLPVSLGNVINSKDDDLFFVLDASGKKGFMSSARKGTVGDKDIFEINFIPIKKENKNSGPRLMLLKGTVTDDETGKPVEATLEIMNNDKNELISKLNSNSSTGRYLVTLPSGKNYGISVSAPGYLFHSENFNIADTAAYIEVVKNIQLHRIAEGKKVVLKNIFFDFDKATLRSESVSELEKLNRFLKENPTVKIELSGHTDNKGTKEYNQKLSESRAKAVVDYLISKGISASRLTFKGYWFSQPISENDTEEGRQLNRRTEFKIMGK